MRILAAAAVLAAICLAQSQITRAGKVAWLASNGVTIRTVDPHDEDFSDLAPLTKSIGDARVVLLGGSDEKATVDAKDRLVRFLHQKMGFDLLIGDIGLIDGEEADREFDRGGAPAADVMTAIEPAFMMRRPAAPKPAKEPPVWTPPEIPHHGPQSPSPPRVITQRPEPEKPDILAYVRSTRKTARPLRLAGTGINSQGRTSSSANGHYVEELFEFVDRAAPHGTTSGDRKMVRSLLKLSSLAPSDRSFRQDEAVWKSAERTLAKVDEALHGVPANSPDSRQAGYFLHTLAMIRFWTLKDARPPRPVKPARPMDGVQWIAQEWRPESKIVVWSQNGLTGRSMPVSRALGAAVYSIAFSEIENESDVPEVLEAGPTPSLVPVGSDLEGLLHAVDKPYVFVDLRSLAEDHWLREPIGSKILTSYVGTSGDGRPAVGPSINSWPRRYDGLISIDLAAIPEVRK